MSPAERISFKRDVKVLRWECPIPLPVRVRLRPMKGFNGRAIFDEKNKRFNLYIDPSDAQVAKDTLLHEWAHLVVWAIPEERGVGEHGPEWGVAYARCYRALENA